VSSTREATAGSDGGKIYAMDQATGEKQWSFDAGGVASSPAVVNGVVYVSGLDGNLYAVQA